MADYTKIIADIHGGNANGHIVDEHNYITIDPKTRQLTLPSDFNSTIAYAGDINSQVVEFLCPKTYDGHSLQDCSNHEIRWYNTGSGVGDTSKLTVSENVDEYFVLSWLVPPEAVTKNGQLQIVISIYDKGTKTVQVEKKEILDQGWVQGPFEDNQTTTILQGGNYYIHFEGESEGVLCYNEYNYMQNYEVGWFGSGDSVYIYDESGTSGAYIKWYGGEEDSTYYKVYKLITTTTEQETNTIKYQWNTAPFTGLSIGATLDNVDVKAPTKDKILTLNTQTRNITLPVGYNTTIAMQGDVGTTKVYIQMSRYINEVDMLSSDVDKYIGWHYTDEIYGLDECTVEKIYSEVEKDDLVLLIWEVDQDLINKCKGFFSFEFSYKIIEHNEETSETSIKKQWYSNSNSSLLIKPNLNIPGDTVPSDGPESIIVEVGVNEEELEKMFNEEFGDKEEI